MREKFAAALIFIAAATLAVAEVQLIPLQDYIGQRGIEADPVALGYVASRCSALYAVFARDLEQETAPERQKFRSEAIGSGERFMGVAVRLLMVETTITLDDALARTRKTIAELGNLYTDRIEAARLRAGNMFTDGLIAGDLRICKSLLAKM
jgi:hypothetical protein